MILQTIQTKININKEILSIALLISMYSAGTIIIGGNLIENFVLLTPFNLLVSISLIFWNHEKWSKKLVLITILCFITGLSVEIIGANTGLIFGEYDYGKTLGLKIANVPLIIGINWLMLVYATAAVVNLFFEKWHFILKAIFSTLLMVGLDFFIEPVAMKYDFWNWANNVIPIENYIAWFVISFCLLSITHRLTVIKNKTAIVLFAVQSLFFIILNLI